MKQIEFALTIGTHHAGIRQADKQTGRQASGNQAATAFRQQAGNRQA